MEAGCRQPKTELVAAVCRVGRRKMIQGSDSPLERNREDLEWESYLMDRTNGKSLERIGSVKAAISLYGQKFNGKSQKDLPTKSGELHLAQLDMRRLNETKISADDEKANAEFELVKAESMVKQLTSEIDKTNAKVMVRKLELQNSRMLHVDGQEDSELMRELRYTKLELTRLKLDLLSVLESKAKAEKQIEESSSRAMSYMRSIEVMSKEIEEASEEHALVELARIEAERESREIESQRKGEADRFSKEIKKAEAKLASLRKEVSESKDLETQLASTNADLSILQSEMELVRAMENRTTEEFDDLELNSARQELEKIQEEGFQYMGSMDAFRDEMMLIAKETLLLQKQEMKTDSKVQRLNSKLLKAKSKMELASEAEERSRGIVSNLSFALQKIQMEVKAEKIKKEVSIQETERTKSKIASTESTFRSTEEKLQAAVGELETVKLSETIALEKLRDVTERTMKNRAALCQKSPTITISRSEFEYLTNSAASAKALADKKVAASEAWIEALKTEEREILLKTQIIEKEIKELRVPEEEEVCKIEKPIVDKNVAASEDKKAAETEWLNIEQPVAATRNLVKEKRVSVATARKQGIRRSSVSTGIRLNHRSPSFTIKKRTVMPNLIKVLRNRPKI